MKFVSISLISVFFIVAVAGTTEQDEDDTNVDQMIGPPNIEVGGTGLVWDMVRCGPTTNCCYTQTRCCMQNTGCCKGKRRVNRAFPCVFY